MVQCSNVGRACTCTWLHTQIHFTPGNAYSVQFVYFLTFQNKSGKWHPLLIFTIDSRSANGAGLLHHLKYSFVCGVNDIITSSIIVPN